MAQRFDCTYTTAGKWRRAFLKDPIAGPCDELRPGKPRSIDDERVAMLMQKALQKKPKDGSPHWSVRAAAAESGVPKSSVQHQFQLFGMKPHRTKSFKFVEPCPVHRSAARGRRVVFDPSRQRPGAVSE